jgi:hypothetical protein
VLAACSTGDYHSGPVTTSTSTTVAEITVRGVVGAYSSSARVIILDQPVSGVANVVVSLDTEIVRASGATASVGDIVARTTVEASGRAGMAGTLIARRVVLP